MDGIAFREEGREEGVIGGPENFLDFWGFSEFRVTCCVISFWVRLIWQEYCVRDNFKFFSFEKNRCDTRNI